MTQNGQENAAAYASGSATDDGQVRDVLIAAKALIADPKDWGQGFECEAPNGKVLCIERAVERVCGDGIDLRRYRSKKVLEEVLGIQPFKFNDSKHTTHEMVMDAFDRAIESVSPPTTDTQKPSLTDSVRCGQTRTRSPEVLTSTLIVIAGERDG